MRYSPLRRRSPIIGPAWVSRSCDPCPWLFEGRARLGPGRRIGVLVREATHEGTAKDQPKVRCTG